MVKYKVLNEVISICFPSPDNSVQKDMLSETSGLFLVVACFRSSFWLVNQTLQMQDIRRLFIIYFIYIYLCLQMIYIAKVIYLELYIFTYS